MVPHCGPALSPHTGLVKLVLEADGLPVELVEVEPRRGYHGLIADTWDDGVTTVFVEHDIIPWPGAVAELLRCEREWCAFPYRHRGGPGMSLGCTKFAGSLMRRNRLVGVEYRRHPMHPWGNGDYHAVDGALFEVLQRWGYREPHEHGPMVAHLNPHQRKARRIA